MGVAGSTAPSVGSSMRSTGLSSSVSGNPSSKTLKTWAAIPDDDAHRGALACIIGTGAWGHWALLVAFEDGRKVVCELTAVNDQGQRFQDNNFLIYDVGDVGEFMRENKYTFNITGKGNPKVFVARWKPITSEEMGLFPQDKGGFCQSWTMRTNMDFFMYRIDTSPADLYRFSKHHPMNGEKYNLQTNNCQKWIKLLLLMNFGIGNPACTSGASMGGHYYVAMKLLNEILDVFILLAEDSSGNYDNSMIVLPSERYYGIDDDDQKNRYEMHAAAFIERCGSKFLDNPGRYMLGEDRTLPPSPLLTDTEVGKPRRLTNWPTPE